MMECSQESLQIYLDGEMDAPARKRMEEHLSRCRSCRQEMARLQLLWLQLGQPGAVDLPLELPYIRQQIIHQSISSTKQARGYNYWDTQKLAWEPALLGASYLPGIGLFSELSQSTLHQIPRLISGTITFARRLISPRGDKKGGLR